LILRALALLLALAGSAHAQGLPWHVRAQDKATVAGGGCTGGYLGSGDALSGAAHYWGVRGYSCAYSTGANNAMIIRRASDNTTSTIKILNTGSLDTASASSFCSATACFVTTLYDQVGTANLTQATNANQPQLIFSCKGTLPCIQFDGSSMILTGTITSISPPISYSTAVNVTGDNAVLGFQIILGTENSGGGAAASLNRSVANSWNSGTEGNSLSSMSSTDATWHTAQATFTTTASTSVLNIDGTETTGSTNGSAGGYTISDLSGRSTAANYYMKGQAGEYRIDTAAYSSGNRTALCHNLRLYWSTAGSC